MSKGRKNIASYSICHNDRCTRLRTSSTYFVIKVWKKSREKSERMNLALCRQEMCRETNVNSVGSWLLRYIRSLAVRRNAIVRCTRSNIFAVPSDLAIFQKIIVSISIERSALPDWKRIWISILIQLAYTFRLNLQI